jgi:biopolymer transport protein ExbB
MIRDSRWSFRWAAALAAASCLITVPASAATPSIPVQLSVGGMFMQADWIVKLVIIGLIFASLATWTVFIAKTMELRRAVCQQRDVREQLRASRTLEAAQAQAELKSAFLNSAIAELRMSADALHDSDGIKERIATQFNRLEAESVRTMTRGVNILATIGATAPFVGLFGTVWGIMNSFIGIAEKQTTNLAVVAPGIAEALLATAVGLVAAIPAVVVYNHFSRQIAAYRALVADSAAAIMNLVSRDLSRGQWGQSSVRPTEKA